MLWFCSGPSPCLSALLKAGRHAEILELLDLAPHKFWHDRKWGVRALIAMERTTEALQYAEDSRDLNDSPIAVAQACEQILLSNGMSNEAIARLRRTVERDRQLPHASHRPATANPS